MLQNKHDRGQNPDKNKNIACQLQYRIIPIKRPGHLCKSPVSHFRWALTEMLKTVQKIATYTVKSRNMCAWGSSFQWFMGIIDGSTRANRPNRKCLLGATSGIIEKKTWVGA